jgi:hypothetical protein
MDSLPEEILIEILDYLEPEELISVQKTCTNLSKPARSNQLWRYKCFERSPSATMRKQNSVLTTLLNAGNVFPNPQNPSLPTVTTRNGVDHERIAGSARARAVNRWDLTGKNERADWYSEYKSRCATLSVDWLAGDATAQAEVKGISLINGTEKIVGYLEDASVCLWDVAHTSTGRRKIRQIARSKSSTLVCDEQASDENLVVDCVSTSGSKTYVAVGSVLNEVDLNVLKVVSDVRYPYPITALSHQDATGVPLTVGTQWSLHILDPRLSSKSSSRPFHESVDNIPAASSSATAILPDMSGNPTNLPSIFGLASPLASSTFPAIQLSGSPSWKPSHRLQNPQWMGYAKVEPGPLSILHHADNEILICGRFPSILSYDRRYFPRLQYVIHSSASLSSMTTIPHPPAHLSPSMSGTSTLVACGEYRGVGSLELYSLPHARSSPSVDNTSIEGLEQPQSPPSTEVFSYKNRQDAARSKLLSVAAHGNKIVYSNSEGGLKWVERDGRSLARRWNINSFETSNSTMLPTSASVNGDLVARKIIPLPEDNSDRGARGDADLLIWTGEIIGIVSTNPKYADHAEMVSELESDGEEKREKEEQERREEEYSTRMRQALERQADERRWMSRFRLRPRHW